MSRQLCSIPLLLVLLTCPLAAQEDEEALDCAAGRTFLAGGSGEPGSFAYMRWIHDCNQLGDSATSTELEERLRRALDDTSLSDFERARLGIRLAQLHVGREQWDEAASLAKRAQTDYLGQPHHDEFVTASFAGVANALGIANEGQPELAAPHLDARIVFLDMQAGTEIYAQERERMLPLALLIALGNAWVLKDLDRASMHAAHMARLREASVERGVEPSRYLKDPLTAGVAHALKQAGRDAEAAVIIGKDPAMLALSASFIARDAAAPPDEDLDRALRHIHSVIESEWWRAGLAQAMDRERELVAIHIDGVVNELRQHGLDAEADRLLAAQHPGYPR